MNAYMTGAQKAFILKMFNCGVLSTTSADWYAQHGYSIVCRGGQAVDIVAEES